MEKLDKKQINTLKKYISVSTVMYLLISIILILANSFFLTSLSQNIICYLIVLIEIVFGVLITKSIFIKNDALSQKHENKYDPILTSFLLKNKIDITENELFAELLYLAKKGYIDIIPIVNEDDYIIRIKDRNKFIRILRYTKLDEEQLKAYTSNDVKAYENLIITRILFDGINEIKFKSLLIRLREHQYDSRILENEYLFEKMVTYEAEKNNFIEEDNNWKSKLFPIMVFINIVVVIITFPIMTGIYFNFVFLLTTILLVMIDIIVLIKSNIFSYQITEEAQKYVNEINSLDDNFNFEDDENLLKDYFILSILLNKVKPNTEVMRLFAKNGNKNFT